jgi:hypothetical protein
MEKDGLREQTPKKEIHIVNGSNRVEIRRSRFEELQELLKELDPLANPVTEKTIWIKK